MKRKIGIVFLLIGVLLMGTELFLKYSNYTKQKEMIRSFERGIISKYKGLTQNTLGIITIPKINLKVAIGEGDDNDTLRYAVGHFKGTAMPGEKGNCCIAGHRSYAYGEYFNRLNEMKMGDEIKVKAKKGEFTYKVYSIQTVLPEDVSVLNVTEDATITLVTCTPIRLSTHRLIIKGRLEK